MQIIGSKRENIVQYIQENEQNRHEFDEIRSAIQVTRAQQEIETAVLQLKKEKGISTSEPIRLKVYVSERIKKYIQFTLEGLLGNRVGVKSVQYVSQANPNDSSFNILGETVRCTLF